MTRILLALSSGTIFGLGLSLSQMINPEKVQNFLDIAGHWDPSLAFVMLGALAVSLVSSVSFCSGPLRCSRTASMSPENGTSTGRCCWAPCSSASAGE